MAVQLFNAGTLCFHHARAQRQAKDDFTLLEPLVRKTEDLQSVAGISEDRAALHNLLAEGRVSPRRASVIADIDSLLLRTSSSSRNKTKATSTNTAGRFRPTTTLRSLS